MSSKTIECEICIACCHTYHCRHSKSIASKAQPCRLSSKICRETPSASLFFSFCTFLALALVSSHLDSFFAKVDLAKLDLADGGVPLVLRADGVALFASGWCCAFGLQLVVGRGKADLASVWGLRQGARVEPVRFEYPESYNRRKKWRSLRDQEMAMGPHGMFT